MPSPWSFGDSRLELTPETDTRELDPEMPFRIIVFGDFSGRANRGMCQPESSLTAGSALHVDRDNVHDLLRRLDVRLENLLARDDGSAVSLAIRELDDLEPDRIVAGSQWFDSLRNTRRKLLDAATFAAAAAEVRRWAKLPDEPRPDSPRQQTPSDVPSGVAMPEDLLEQALANTASVLGDRLSAADRWNQVIQEIVAPYIVPGADPKQQQYVDCVDQAIGKTLQAILHHPDFQTVESNWRALHLLVRRLETDERLKLHLVDVSKQELAADLAGEDATTSGLRRLLTRRSPGLASDEPWGLLVGAYTFHDTPEDVELLQKLAQVASSIGAPWLSAAAGAVVGCPSSEPSSDPDDWLPSGSLAWHSLRQRPEADYLGLTWPRFLLRLPYGQATNPIESFSFEECDSGLQHRQLPWGNAAYLAALALGDSFVQAGWRLRPGQEAEIGNLPSYAYDDDGESRLAPCCEVVLGDRAVERVLTQGVIPLLATGNGDSARFAGMRALSGRPLKGRWQ